MPRNADPYAPLAPLYDSEMDGEVHALYREWRRHLLAAIGRYRVPVRRLVDLACGTGNTAIPWLARRGWEIVGVDASRAMLAQARRKSRRVRWRRQDMRKLTLPERADVVTCHFDALNHLLAPGYVQRTFRRVFASLNDGGLFQFDLNTRHWLAWLGGREKLFRKGRNYFVAFNEYNPGKRLATFHQLWFVREGGMYRRRLVTVRERAYEIAEIRRMLAAAGFELLAATAQRRCEGKPMRLLFLARKPRA